MTHQWWCEGGPLCMCGAEIQTNAIMAGCTPKWHDGIFGPAWHCTCKGNVHGCDQQCSMITLSSLVANDRY